MAKAASRKRHPGQPRVRYAVIGLGHIAQTAVLPGFRHAAGNSELAALVSSDPVKRDQLGRRYRIAQRLGYDELDRLADEGLVDAAYVALPNDFHHDITIRLANLRLHVLCEKPLAMTEAQCREMIDVANAREVRLMTAYRLHFDPATLAAVEAVRSGKIGEPRYFASTFSMQVTDPNNIRLSGRGGGPLYDLGVYCINAARMMFGDEPIEAFAMESMTDDPRFTEVPGTVTAMLRFPRDRVASFTCSFESGGTSAYRVVGTKGDLLVEPAFEYAEGLAHRLTIEERVSRKRFPRGDQFGAELTAFSNAILTGDARYPGGDEGLADVRVIGTLLQSAAEGRALSLPPLRLRHRPDPDQARALPPVTEPEEVHARGPGD